MNLQGVDDMAETATSTIEKALALNLDPLKYGTIVEIGAGQEVARWFFQAGAAAGTVAKTMSAYDMKFSDEIYGTASDQRYVSRGRLERMLEQEFDLVVSRIQDHRPDDSTFFAFADTVAAQGFKTRAECHGWLGVRFQCEPRATPDEILIHVRMLDDTNLEQQEALGIVGVNLIHGAFFHRDNPAELLRSLVDGMKWGRVEIDLVEMRGPKLDAFDNRLLALELVKASLARAVLFDPDGKVVIPADALYKHRVLAMRGTYYTVEPTDIDMFTHAKMQFSAQHTDADSDILCLAEMTMAQLANDQNIDTGDFLARVNRLSEAGYYVLISEFFRYFRVSQYFSRYSRKPAAIVTDLEGLGDIFREDYYGGLSGGILESLGQLFTRQTVLYVYPSGPSPDSGGSMQIDDLPIADAMRPLLTYLMDRRQIVLIDNYNF